MSSYKICKFCGEYEHQCHCAAAREIDSLRQQVEHKEQALEKQSEECRKILGYDDGDPLDNVTRYKKYAESEIALRDRKAKAGLEYCQALEKQIKESTELHNMQLVAVMTASMQNTRNSIKDRIGKANPYWSQAYADTCTAVDREIKLREELSALTSPVTQNQKCTCGEPHISKRIVHRYDGKPCYVSDV